MNVTHFATRGKPVMHFPTHGTLVTQVVTRGTLVVHVATCGTLVTGAARGPEAAAAAHAGHQGPPRGRGGGGRRPAGRRPPAEAVRRHGAPRQAEEAAGAARPPGGLPPARGLGVCLGGCAPGSGLGGKILKIGTETDTGRVGITCARSTAADTRCWRRVSTDLLSSGCARFRMFGAGLTAFVADASKEPLASPQAGPMVEEFRPAGGTQPRPRTHVRPHITAPPTQQSAGWQTAKIYPQETRLAGV